MKKSYLVWSGWLGRLIAVLVVVSGCGPQDELDLETEPGGPGKESEFRQREDEVVYGTDDRRDLYDHINPLLRSRAHQSTVALMSASTLNTSNPNNITFNAPPLGTSRNLCSTERFLDDPTAAFCSGTLIDDDLVLTAGHCINTTSCADTRFVFNYHRPAAGTLQTVTTSDVFSCQSVVVRQVADQDYAIVRLDRKAAPRFTPAPVRAEISALATGQNVAVIGSGSGVPYKLDIGGSVRDPRASTLDFFVATTDTFHGNSGSGVYETSSFSLVGVLVRGEVDYTSNGSCNVVKTCAQTACSGEDVTYVRPAVQAYCAVASSPRLCGIGSTENALVYQANATNSATVGTVNTTIQLVAGQTLTLGSCGLAGAFARGDTYLRLYDPNGTAVAFTDDGCSGRGSFLKYTATLSGAYQLRAGCYANTGCGGTVSWALSTLPYSAANTNYATANTTNRKFTLTEGQEITLGTCGLPGAAASGDTYLRLFNPSGSQVAFSDDACGGTGSNLTYKVPAGQGGAYELRAGCYANNTCAGTVAWSSAGGTSSIVYSASSTNNATTGTHTRELMLSAGQVLTLGTCGTPNAYTNSDTYLWLFNPSGVEVASNDDACGLGSSLTYTVPATGIYQVRAGCFENTTCSGSLSWSTR